MLITVFFAKVFIEKIGVKVDIFGVGPMELILILFIGFIFLGPGRMAEGGRYLGKAMKELRKTTSDMSKLVFEEEEGNTKEIKNPKSSVEFGGKSTNLSNSRKQNSYDQDLKDE